MLTTFQAAIVALWNLFLQTEEDQEAQLRAAVQGRDFFAAEAQLIADEAGIEPPDSLRPELMPFLPDVLLRMLAEQAHQTAQGKGWYEDPEPPGTRIALLHSEASELLEHYRKGREHEPCDKVPSISNGEEELADIIIRVLDFSVAEGYDVGRAVFEKMRFNLSRPHKHGNKKF